MTWLPDINVLISLIDPTHILHQAAHRSFAGLAGAPWATCLTTENAVMRIVGHPNYPNSAGFPAVAAPFVIGVRTLLGHVFRADDLSLAASALVHPTATETPGEVTDTDLLPLAVSQRGRLATFDRRLSAGAVQSGRRELHAITRPAARPLILIDAADAAGTGDIRQSIDARPDDHCPLVSSQVPEPTPTDRPAASRDNPPPPRTIASQP